MEISEKLTIRNLLAVGFLGIFAYVVYSVTSSKLPEENTVLMLILGALITNVGTIVIFYFRKAQAKESKV